MLLKWKKLCFEENTISLTNSLLVPTGQTCVTRKGVIGLVSDAHLPDAMVSQASPNIRNSEEGQGGTGIAK